MEWFYSDVNWVLGIRNPILDHFFLIFPFFASEVFYLGTILVGYWCWKRGLFREMCVWVCLSLLLNWWLKGYFGTERPGIEQLVKGVHGKSFPSGDVQVAVVYWGILCYHFRRKWLYAVSGVLLGLIGLSRVYLGAHYPIDVVGGFAIGGAILGLYGWTRRSGKLFGVYDGTIIEVVITGVFLSVYFYLLGDNDNKLSIVGGALLMGVAVGKVFYKGIPFPTMPRFFIEKTVLAIIGLTGVVLLRKLMKIEWGGEHPELRIFITYLFLGFYSIYVVPLTYGLLKRRGQGEVSFPA